MAASTGIEYLDLYQSMLAHQKDHDGALPPPLASQPEQPSWRCLSCMQERRDTGRGMDIRKTYSWAVPDEAALKLVAEHSPGGVVEVGAGGGYWAMLLQQRGVDVVAFDPQPPGLLCGGSHWHTGRAWTRVRRGDHTQAANHPGRTLLLCWPSYGEPWAAQAVEAYAGDSVVYIGEEVGGCTADDRFHALLGEAPSCWHFGDEECDCPPPPEPLFERVAEHRIPQWSGLHDTLSVYRRIGSRR